MARPKPIITSERKSDPSGNQPFAMRLPPEIRAALEARAEAEGISPGEVARNVLHAWFAGDVPSADQGYYTARAKGIRLARMLLAKAYGELPATDEEADAILVGFERANRI